MPNVHRPLDPCAQKETINDMAKDVETIKIALGYKEKSNGEFREEVKATDKNLSERLDGLEENIILINSSLNSIKWIMAIAVPVIAAIIIEILIKL